MLSKFITLFLLISIQLFCYKIVYINSGGACYYVSDKAEDWFDALTVCQLLGRCLASIRTPEMFASLTKHFTNNSKLTNVEFWSGMNSYEKKVFTYVEDSTLVKYVPSDVKLDPKGSCVYVKIEDTGNPIMKTDLCCRKKRFICADAIECNKRKLKIHHTLVLERENEVASDICRSMKRRTKNIRTGSNRTKTRSGDETFDEERKKKSESIWKKFVNILQNAQDKVFEYSLGKVMQLG